MRETLVAPLYLKDDIDVAVDDHAVSAALACQPDLAVLDIGLPGVSGPTAAAELSIQLPVCRVLILTGLPGPGQLRGAWQAGAYGFLLKDGQPMR